MLGNIGKEAGADAVHELHQTVDSAIPELGKQAKAIVDEAGNQIQNATDRASGALAGLVSDIANRLNGAKIPVDLTIEASARIRVFGQIGSLQLSNPEVDYSVKPSAEVVG